MSDADQLVVLNYPEWPDKGTIVRGCRLTILTARTRVHPGEEVRVIHVVEAMDAGTTLFLMATKPVLGEHVDGRLVTAAQADAGDPLRPPGLYDGPVVRGPAVDSGYQVSAYRFDATGMHRIVWRLGEFVSNELLISVA